MKKKNKIGSLATRNPFKLKETKEFVKELEPVIVSEKVKAFFETSSVESGKTIYISADDALEGVHKNNYYIGTKNLNYGILLT